MKKLLAVLAFILAPAMAHAQSSGDYVRNDALAVINGPNLTVGSAAVDGAGRVHVHANASAGPNIGKVEDSAAVSGDGGVPALTVKQFVIAADSADGDYTWSKSDSGGRQYVNSYMCNGSLFSRICTSAITGTASTAILNNAGAGIRWLVTDVDCVNNSTVSSTLNLLDGAAIVWSGFVNSNANPGNVWQKSFALPLRGSANTAFNVQLATTATSTVCCATACQVSDF